MASLRRRGRIADAYSFSINLLRKNPRDSLVVGCHAVLCAERGNLNEAARYMRLAIDLDPHDASNLYNLGKIEQGRRRFEAAVTALRQALAIEPAHADSWLVLGNCLRELRRHDEAIDCFRQALCLAPDMAGACHNLAMCLEEKGELAKAERTFRRTLEIDPTLTDAWRHIVELRQGRVDENDVVTMRALQRGHGLDDEQRSALDFALGRALADCGDHEAAFAAYAEANRLRRARIEYDTGAMEQHFDRIRRCLDEAFLARHREAGIDDPTPIFIVGMPRSGTTLVEQILTRHDQVYGAGECYLLHDLVSARSSRQPEASYPDSLLDCEDDVLNRLAAEYVAGLRKVGGSMARITDKMPQNFLYLGLIGLVLPKAHIVHCRRDPLDTALSIFFHPFPPGHDYAYDLVEIGHYYRLYDRLMAHWHALLPGRIHDIQYERLITQQEAETQRLLTFCGLDWQASCLEPHKGHSTVQTLSVAQVREAVHDRSVRRWEHYRAWIGPLLEVLGKERPRV